MIVSHNELVSAVQKAFLGSGRLCGEADAIATMVADLQMAGLNGVAHFNKASQFLSQENDGGVTLISCSDERVVIELNNSIACHLPAILDFSVEQMVKNKSITVLLKQCHNRWLAYSELMKLAAKGIACRAQWVNGSSPKRVLYVLNRGCIAPDIFFSDRLNQTQQDDCSMIIELSAHDFDLFQSSRGYSIHIDAQQLHEAQKLSWQNGIVVEDDQWSQLKRSARHFLVETNEHSAKGAGELA
ncbi:DUF3726 domain-containing protein [Vibrio ostreicida]|uniref:DUF3726 domain-containing protein n=1 Tax=Vibrio ostreicida TaxID=526588 RepID=UPI0009709E64|nr:DUF3726 domain-containing protein [Vibrio ostreicida]